MYVKGCDKQCIKWDYDVKRVLWFFMAAVGVAVLCPVLGWLGPARPVCYRTTPRRRLVGLINIITRYRSV